MKKFVFDKSNPYRRQTPTTLGGQVLFFAFLEVMSCFLLVTPRKEAKSKKQDLIPFT
jgi:hypothetical protein